MTNGQVPAQASPDDVRELEDEIAATRERLGDAVEQLAAKLDVKSQARAQASRLTGEFTAAARRARGRAAAMPARPAGLAAAGGLLVVGACLAVLLLRRQR